MSMADLGSLGEFVASIVVLITLLFLALQMRRSTAEIKLRNDMDRSGSTVQAGLGLMGANAVEAYTKALLHPSDLTEDEGHAGVGLPGRVHGGRAQYVECIQTWFGRQ